MSSFTQKNLLPYQRKTSALSAMIATFVVFYLYTFLYIFSLSRGKIIQVLHLTEVRLISLLLSGHYFHCLWLDFGVGFFLSPHNSMSNLDYFCTSRSGGNKFTQHNNSAVVLHVLVGICLLVGVLV